MTSPIIAAIVWTIYFLGTGILLGWFLKSNQKQKPKELKNEQF